MEGANVLINLSGLTESVRFSPGAFILQVLLGVTGQLGLRCGLIPNHNYLSYVAPLLRTMC